MHSLVTITYNNFEELTATVDSVTAASDRQDIEHIIVNGGTCERTREFLQQHDGPVIQEPDHGISDAFNKGMRVASGSSISFLNSGDLLTEPGYYDYCAERLSVDSSIDHIYAQLVIRKADGRADLRGLLDDGTGMPYPHPTVVVRKELADRVGAFRLRYKVCMDFDWICRMLKISVGGHYYEHAVIEMDGTGVSNTSDDRGALENIRILSSHDLLTWKAFRKQAGVYLKVRIKKLLRAHG